MENLRGRGFGAIWLLFHLEPFAWEIVHDSPMVNFVSVVIGGEVYVAWKCKMLHDITGGCQAYIQREIYEASNFAAG